MKRRFFISKSLLIVASFFWASCSEDDTQPISINESATESSSSGDALPQSSNPNSSGAAEGISSGTTGPYSSSSVGEQSNNSAEFRLASDTSVTCEKTSVSLGYTCEDPDYSCYANENQLKNNTELSVEELIQFENRLENCSGPVTVYGITPAQCSQKTALSATAYNCSNGKQYYDEKNGLIYTLSEYKSLFNSSSSEASSSSSEASSSSAAPSPLCQKSDFIYKRNTVEDISKEKLDSLATAGETVSDSLKNCVRRSFPYEEGKYAKTQICDGDTTVNPYYQAKLDSIREEVDKTIKDCKAAEVPADSTKTPADSTDTPKDSTDTPADTTNTPA